MNDHGSVRCDTKGNVCWSSRLQTQNSHGSAGGRWLNQVHAVRLALIAGLMLGTVFVSGQNSAPSAGKPAKLKKPAQTDRLFSGAEIPPIEIEISQESVEKLGGYLWRPGVEDRPSVMATVRAGGVVYTNVALHLKGAAGSFRSIHDNPALTLNFDKHVKGQRFHGLEKLSLNNSVQDPTFISEQFCRELFLKAGVPVPRAAHAVVQLNGRSLGLYVLVEGWDKQFLRRHFKNAKGNLYDGGFLKDIDAALSTNSGDKPDDQSDRIRLVEATKESNLSRRLELIEKVLDVQRFLTFVALDVMLWDWDGYALNRNNWRLFHDMDSGKMVFMPHGLDQMFWNPDGSILPTMQGMVAKALLEIPEIRQRYFERVKQLRRDVFVPESLTNRVQQIASRLTPILEKQDPKLAKEQLRSVDGFVNAIVRRGQSIDRQLAHPIEPLKFDASGFVSLKTWDQQRDFGKPALSKISDPQEVLRVAAPEGSSIGSWRTRVWLEGGKYRALARIKTDGMVADPGDTRAGIGFRLANRRPENYRLENKDWTETIYDFVVPSGLTEIQLICEFRAAAGEALVDLTSLKLQKVE